MKKLLLSYVILCQIMLFVQCNQSYSHPTQDVIQTDDTLVIIPKIPLPFEPDTLKNREKILQLISQKKTKGTPLVVHIYIPLCDNINQGIVPTTASLGNGMSLKSNLYWATRSGTKRFFTNHPKWELIYDQLDIDTNVLERVVFKRKYTDTEVYLVADAYRGDRMEATINDFLAALSQNREQTVVIDSNQQVNIAQNADLIMFNGHNGMMDRLTIKNWVNTTDRHVDAVINACVSYKYFDHQLIKAGAYPLARTNSLLHPGAYVLTQIIDDWVAGIDERNICLNAGRAYCIKHDCGRGSKIYKSGW